MTNSSSTTAGSPTYLTLCLLGHPELTLNGTPPSRPLSEKALALLIFLALEGQRDHGRQELITLFWPEASRTAGQNSLRQALFSTRDRLPNALPVIAVSRTLVGIDSAIILRVDAFEFTALFDACHAHTHRRLDALCPAWIGLKRR